MREGCYCTDPATKGCKVWGPKWVTDLIANSPFDLRAYTGKARRRTEPFTRSPFNQLCFHLLLLFVLFCLICLWSGIWHIYFTSDLSNLGQSIVTGILLQCRAFLWAKPDTGKSVSYRYATGLKFKSHTINSLLEGHLWDQQYVCLREVCGLLRANYSIRSKERQEPTLGVHFNNLAMLQRFLLREFTVLVLSLAFTLKCKGHKI